MQPRRGFLNNHHSNPIVQRFLNNNNRQAAQQQRPLILPPALVPRLRANIENLDVRFVANVFSVSSVNFITLIVRNPHLQHKITIITYINNNAGGEVIFRIIE